MSSTELLSLGIEQSTCHHKKQKNKKTKTKKTKTKTKGLLDKGAPKY